MDETPQWVSLTLDSGTAQFLGLPDRLHVPLTALSAMEGGLSVARLAAALHKAVDLNPRLAEEPQIRHFLARSEQLDNLENYLRVGNLTFAAQVAKDLYKRDPKDPLALSTLGRLALLEEHFDQSVEHFQATLHLAPSHGPSQVEYALALAGNGHTTRALELLRTLLDHRAVGLLARIWRWELEHAHMDHLGERLEFLRRVLQQPENTAATASDLIKRFPGNPEARFLTAVHPSWREPEGARIATLQSVLRDAPYHIQARVLLSQLLRRAGQPQNALEILENAPETKDALIHAARGICLEHLAERDEARAAYRSVFELPLEHLPHVALIQAGQGLLRVGSPPETRVFLEEAIRARPQDSLPRQILARLEELEGNAEACEKRLREAQRDCGQTPGLAYALGDFLRRGGRESEALGIYKALVNQEPASPWGHRGLGDLALNEQPQRAVEHYTQALALEPDTPIAGYDYLRGVAALRTRKFEEAEAWLARAVASEPDNARYWCDLGAAHFYCGRIDPALEATERAIVLDPKNPGFIHNLYQYHQLHFKAKPLQHWKSFFAALRLKRKSNALAKVSSDWQKDLWPGG